jgi:hypothetical protein
MATTIDYMLNRGDWRAFYGHENTVYWEKNRLRLRLWNIAISIGAYIALAGCVGVGAFFIGRGTGWSRAPLDPASPTPWNLARGAICLTLLASGVAILIVQIWLLDTVYRDGARNRAAAAVNKGEKSGAIQTGKRYQLTISPAEIQLTITLELKISGFSFATREEYRFPWEVVCDTEVAGTLLLIRTNGPVVIVPCRAFTTPVDFHRLQNEVDHYRNNRQPIAVGGPAMDSDRPTTFKSQDSIQV